MNLRNWGWFIIIQKTKPLIGQSNPEDELRQLEEKAMSAYGAYEEQVNTKKRLEEENEKIKVEKEALIKQIESEQGNMSQYVEKQAVASAAKADIEAKLQVAIDHLAKCEQERQSATATKKNLEGNNQLIKKEGARLQ